MVRLDDILEQVRSYAPEADSSLLHKAVVFSGKVHRGQLRPGGEPYLNHSLEIGFILARLKLDVATIVTGMLHDILQEGLAEVREIREFFGDSVGELVEGVTKLGRLTFTTSEEQQAENFRKMLLAMARDIRVILVKLAERLHEMRTLERRSEAEQCRIAQETLDIYAPLANRLGISWIKCELEDLALKHVLPQVYKDLRQKLDQTQQDRAGYVEEVKKQLRAKLEANGLQGEVSGRPKHLYSIYRKMERQGIEFEQVYDRVAFRIIVRTVPECYAVLGIIHASWKPIAGRFKDYIAMPKPNMYQSLHTTVIGPLGERMEVQIRTEEMHRVAEEGIAAHWKYKEGRTADEATTDEDQFGWLRQVLETHQDMTDSHELVGAVKIDLFSEEVYVFTPKGEVKAFPRGATPIDFAYSVHTEVGHRCVGARINGKLVPLRTPLKNGDVVEVVTSAGQRPSKDWLKFVATSRAASKIRQWIKTEQREKSIELGKELLEKRLRKYGMSLKKALASRELAQAMQDLGYQSSSELLAAVGYGKLPPGQLVSRVVPPELLKPEAESRAARLEPGAGPAVKKPASAIRLQGIDDIMVRFAKCCSPLPGDPVTGFITRGRGITVHAADCPSVLQSDPARRVEVEWDLKKKVPHTAHIRIHSVDQKGVLAAVTNAVSACEANIVSANVQTSPDQKGVIVFAVSVEDVQHLNRVINALLKVKGVQRVERLRH